MYFYLMLSDIIATIILETLSQINAKPDEVTKEDWLELSKINMERRKAAMDRIKAH
jgi:hypothetical protein